MISRQNIKYFIVLSFIAIIMYKILDSPSAFILGINGIASFFKPFLLAILFALLLNPFIMFLEKNIKTPRLLNILIGYVFVILILFVGFKLLIPVLIDAFTQLILDVPYYIDIIDNFLYKTISSSESLQNLSPYIQDRLNSILNQAINLLTRMTSDSFEYVVSITSLFFNIVMGIILSIYILCDKEKISLSCKKILLAFYTKKSTLNIINFFKVSHDIFYSYIIGKIIDSLIVGAIAFIVFNFIIKIDNVIFLSVIIFITNMIPYFGPFIGAIPPILMTLTYSPIKALWVAIFVLVLQQIDGNIIGPKVMGEQVGLSPLWIISSVLIGGSLFGVVGVFLSVPVAAILKFTIDTYIEKRINTKDSL